MVEYDGSTEEANRRRKRQDIRDKTGGGAGKMLIEFARPFRLRPAESNREQVRQKKNKKTKDRQRLLLFLYRIDSSSGGDTIRQRYYPI